MKEKLSEALLAAGVPPGFSLSGPDGPGVRITGVADEHRGLVEQVVAGWDWQRRRKTRQELRAAIGELSVAQQTLLVRSVLAALIFERPDLAGGVVDT